MSDLWCYEPKKCDYDHCPMDCEKCRKAEEEEDEAD